jgi:hypothetical protein
MPLQLVQEQEAKAAAKRQAEQERIAKLSAADQKKVLIRHACMK